MKKLLVAVVSIALVSSVNAQEAADKKFQAGLVFGAGMNFQKMQTKLMNGGVGSDLLLGGTMNVMFTETIGFNTGIEFNFNTAKYTRGDAASVYYLYNDSKIEQYTEPNLLGYYEDKRLFALDTRKQKATYVMIPTMLVFKTNFIGYFRYFGKLGLNSGVLVSSKTNDTGKELVPSNVAGPHNPIADTENNNMKSSGSMFVFRSSVGISGGAEWNFTGSTCLVAEIGYFYGLTPQFNKRSGKEYQVNYPNVNDFTTATPFSNKATQSQLQLKISILF